ncbi:MAG: DUF4276 family protein [Syntrophomonadaceae bacterium]|nr:DUF4276 family protein [Syntrophomonadaceae bacterium]
MRFVLFVEGETESKVLPAFFKRWLDPQLSRPVGIRTVKFQGWPDLCQGVKTKADRYLNGPDKDEIIAVISLLDLYGPDCFPAHLRTIKERVGWGTRQIEDRVGHPRFKHYFAVHELEAWLLSDPRIFPNPVSRAIPPGEPESINMDRPPKALLKNLYRTKIKSTYKEIIHGTDLFGRLDPNLAYQRCPHLQQMLDDMLHLIALQRLAN